MKKNKTDITKRKWFQITPGVVSEILPLLCVSAVLVPVFAISLPWPDQTKKYLFSSAILETGAQNLVSSLYLGYRAFDTLGETVVLLTAVTGAIMIIKSSVHTNNSYTFSQQNVPSKTRMLRTELLDTVTGKLGPVVLLFGFYVMLFGHLSPGGGFQGGVVIASAIVFLSLGSKSDGALVLTKPGVLLWIEAASFGAFLIAACAGMITGNGFFTNPFPSGFPAHAYIIFLNCAVGLKVGAGVSFLCIEMIQNKE